MGLHEDRLATLVQLIGGPVPESVVVSFLDVKAPNKFYPIRGVLSGQPPEKPGDFQRWVVGKSILVVLVDGASIVGWLPVDLETVSPTRIHFDGHNGSVNVKCNYRSVIANCHPVEPGEDSGDLLNERVLSLVEWVNEKRKNHEG